MGFGRKIFTLGALAVGAVAGAIFAPKKGSQLRKEFAKEWSKGGSGAKTLKTNASKVGEDIAQTTKEIYESKQVQEKKEAIKKSAKESAEKAKKTAKEQYSKILSKAEDEIKKD